MPSPSSSNPTHESRSNNLTDPSIYRNRLMVTAFVSEDGGCPALWISAVIFAHVFAAFFLYQAWALMHPKSAAMRGLKRCCWRESAAMEDEGVCNREGASRPTIAEADLSDPCVPASSLTWRELGYSYGMASGPRAVLRVRGCNWIDGYS